MFCEAMVPNLSIALSTAEIPGKLSLREEDGVFKFASGIVFLLRLLCCDSCVSLLETMPSFVTAGRESPVASGVSSISGSFPSSESSSA